MDDTKYLTECGIKKINKLLIFDNKEFKLNLVYEDGDNITDEEFDKLIRDIVKMDSHGNFSDVDFSLNTKYIEEKKQDLDFF